MFLISHELWANIKTTCIQVLFVLLKIQANGDNYRKTSINICSTTYIYVHKFVIACTLKMIELHVHIKLILQLYSEYFMNRILPTNKYVVCSISILFRNKLFCHFLGVCSTKWKNCNCFHIPKIWNFLKHFPVEVD